MKIVSRDELATRLSALPPHSRVVTSGNMAMPADALKILETSCETYTLNALNACLPIPDREGVVAETSFVGTGMRKNKNLRYIPCRLSMVPHLFRSTVAPDVVLVHCAPPREGQLSLGLEVNVLPAAIEACRARGGLVIAVINEHMPYTLGDAQIPVSHVELGYESHTPLATANAAAPDEASAQIGAQVATRVGNGATLQMGIGAVPDATVAALTEHRDLRIWTEMFSDGALALDRSGALSQDHPLITSFIFGSQELYDWVDGNPRVRMLRTEKTNDPALIALQPQMTSVNTALQVDLFGQANASRIKARIYSGFGGQTDFIVGALHAPGGQSFIALRSWHPRADVSTVVPLVSEPVTSFQQSAIVTEQGIAELNGCSEREQAQQIINNAAHPDAREFLTSEAQRLGLS